MNAQQRRLRRTIALAGRVCESHLKTGALLDAAGNRERAREYRDYAARMSAQAFAAALELREVQP